MQFVNRVREVLAYNPYTGEFVWRLPTGPRASRKKSAGTVNVRGYAEISVDGVKYVAHRLAWLYINGSWPVRFIDHINGDKLDNRIENLRDVSRFTNAQNRRYASAGNSTNLLGVSRHKDKFRARIQVNGVMKRLGTFDTPEEAHEIYLAAKRDLHVGCTI